MACDINKCYECMKDFLAVLGGIYSYIYEFSIIIRIPYVLCYDCIWARKNREFFA